MLNNSNNNENNINDFINNPENAKYKFIMFDGVLNVFNSFEDEDESSSILDKDNIFAKENFEKVLEIISNYKNKFNQFIEKKSEYKMQFNEESLIAIDSMITSDWIFEEIKTIEGDKDINKFLFDIATGIGAFLLLYLKKKLRMPPKIEYPIHKSYFVKGNKTIRPFFIAMQKISIDKNITLYEYLGDLIASLNDDDFKADEDFIEEIKYQLRPFLVKWTINKI